MSNSFLSSVRAFCTGAAWPVTRNSSWIARHRPVDCRFFGPPAEASTLRFNCFSTPLVSLSRLEPPQLDSVMGRIEISYGFEKLLKPENAKNPGTQAEPPAPPGLGPAASSTDDENRSSVPHVMIVFKTNPSEEQECSIELHSLRVQAAESAGQRHLG